MNLLDVGIVLMVVAASLGGFRLGFVARASAWLGMAAGLLLAARLVPALTERFAANSPDRVLLIVAAALLVGASLGQLLGATVGARLRLGTGRGALRHLDRTAGALSGIVAVALAVWLLTPTMATVPDWPARQVEGSLIARTIERLTPPPPNPVPAVEALLGDRWADLAGRNPGLTDVGDPPPPTPPPPSVLTAATAATVRIDHQGCDPGQQGTGFVVAPDLVATNAHVVAGEAHRNATRVVRDDDMFLDATLVAFDPRTDVAILHVPGIDRDPLPLAEDGALVDGLEGWVFGHPGGRPLDVRPFRARGPIAINTVDIYGDLPATTRTVLPLAADLQEGDSGSALVGLDGTVVGVAFAIAPDQERVALALVPAHVRRALDDAAPVVAVGDSVAGGRCMPRR